MYASEFGAEGSTSGRYFSTSLQSFKMLTFFTNSRRPHQVLFYHHPLRSSPILISTLSPSITTHNFKYFNYFLFIAIFCLDEAGVGQHMGLNEKTTLSSDHIEPSISDSANQADQSPVKLGNQTSLQDKGKNV